MRLKKLRSGGGDCGRTRDATSKAMRSIAALFMCACFSKRCKTCQTLYQSRMIRPLAVALIAISLMSTASGRSKHCILRVYAQANPQDTDVFASPVTAPISGKRIFVEKIPTISEYDVSAYRAYPATNGTFGVVLQLDEHGRVVLETLSIEHRGRTLLVILNGRPVTELSVDRRVSDGQIYIASGLTAADLELMRKDWPQIGAKKRR